MGDRVKLRILDADELTFIKSSWKMNENGNLVWARKTNRGKNIDDLVGLATKKSGHQVCFVWFKQKLRGYSLAKVAWFLQKGFWAESEIDHIDNNPQNNRIENLRLANRSQQMRNRVAGKIGRKNKGVYKREYGEKWSAQIWVNGKCKCLGTFDSEEKAVEARKFATLELHGEFANLSSYN